MLDDVDDADTRIQKAQTAQIVASDAGQGPGPAREGSKRRVEGEL